MSLIGKSLAYACKSSYLKFARSGLQRSCNFLAKKQLFYKSVSQSFACRNRNCLYYSTDDCSGKEHSHHITWIGEKFGSIALLILIPTAIIYPSTAIDYLVSPLIAIHHYVGIEQVLSDYARPAVVGKTPSKICEIINLITTCIALLGFILFSKNQMCLGEAIQCLWSVKSGGESD